MTNDLLSYSIMLNGDKAITHGLPHMAPLSLGKLEAVLLPPLSSYVNLTERNLNSFNSYTQRPVTSTGAPSLTLLLASELPLLSPRFGHAEVYRSGASSGLATPRADSKSIVPGTPDHEQRKRRQRLGPSCDNCRARKVKCNAEVLLLNRHFSAPSSASTSEGSSFDDALDEEYAELLHDQKDQLGAGAMVRISDNYILLLLNSKLIKFRPCLSCRGKGLDCCFLKGFTKEDIVHNKRRSSGDCSSKHPGSVVSSGADSDACASKILAGRVTKHRSDAAGNLRKSLCVACRRRKVKCVVNARAGRCVGCMKKDTACLFDA